MRLLGKSLLAFVVAAVVLYAAPAQAVIVYGSAGRNTTPDGAPVGSGWQYQGKWGSFLGTPIGPRHFITAGHVGGSVGQAFTYGGANYTTTNYYDDPSSDLRIWEVSGTFNSYAPLYSGSSEVGKSLTVFGRGTQRGAEVRVNNVLKGWRWGASDGVQSWGTNTVDGVASGGTGLGQLLAFDFDAGKGKGGANEATVSVGDSGGAVFVLDGSVWKLAGINYAVESTFSLTGATGSGFSAAIFDKGGLFTGGDGKWALTPDARADKPAWAYASRISSNLPWINSITGSFAFSSSGTAWTPVPEPTLGIFAAMACVPVLFRRRRSGGRR